MTVRRASCRCGKLTAAMSGEPSRVSVCHCRSCRAATGAAFSAQARFADDAVTFGGEWATWEREGDAGATAWYRWCPACGSTIGFTNRSLPGSVAILLGAIVDGPIPTPGVSVYEDRKMPWVEIVGDAITHID